MRYTEGMVDEKTKPSSTAGALQLGSEGRPNDPHSTSRVLGSAINASNQPSDGVPQAITAFALYPLLKLFRLLSKLTSRSLISSDAAASSNLIGQEGNKPDHSRNTHTNGLTAGVKHPSLGLRASDLGHNVKAVPADGQISIDSSFDGVDPASPNPIGKRDAGHGRVT